ncbi:MAG: 4'-phosphopantetheinyl transferase superfamily protein [Gammaproteobacteria bacterium]
MLNQERIYLNAFKTPQEARAGFDQWMAIIMSVLIQAWLESNNMLDGLFPEGVITETAAPWMWSAELTHEEKAIIENAVDKRRREFAAGRTCARYILRQFGFSGDLTIGKDKYGAPIWPEGITGSISHTDDVCVVSIGRQKQKLTSLGVDVEKDTGLDPDLVDLVCDEIEKETCCTGQIGDRLRLAKVIFSAKESVYKCLYPLIKTVLDFQDVHIQLDASGEKFTGSTNGNLHGDFARGICNGRVFHEAGYIYTSCTFGARPNRPQNGDSAAEQGEKARISCE